MARPLKEGLGFFSHDTDMSDDHKIMCLEAKHGLIGYAIYNKLLERIYKTPTGTLPLKTDVDKNILSKRFGISQKKLTEIINYCASVELFDYKTLESFNELTSNGIKKRYEQVLSERERKRKHYEKYSKLSSNNPVTDVHNNGETKDISLDNIIPNSGEPPEMDAETKYKDKYKDKLNINNNTSNEDGSDHQSIKSLTEMKETIATYKNKVGYLGKVFLYLHPKCTLEDKKLCYDRLGKMAKQYSNDYEYVLTAIYKTQDGIVLIEGSHLNYIEKLLQNKNNFNNNGNGNGGHQSEVTKKYEYVN